MLFPESPRLCPTQEHWAHEESPGLLCASRSHALTRATSGWRVGAPFIGTKAPQGPAPTLLFPSLLCQQDGEAGHSHDCCGIQWVWFGLCFALPVVRDGNRGVLWNIRKHTHRAFHHSLQQARCLLMMAQILGPLVFTDSRIQNTKYVQLSSPKAMCFACQEWNFHTFKVKVKFLGGISVNHKAGHHVQQLWIGGNCNNNKLRFSTPACGQFRIPSPGWPS